MTFSHLRTPSSLSLVVVALATAACGDATAPAATVGSPPNIVVNSAVLVQPKKPVIQSVQLSTTSLELDSGIAATFSATILNPIGRGSRTYTDAFLQGQIRQGGVVAPTGGFGVRCDAGPNGVLPLGTCSVIGFTISTLAGSLVAGPAAFELTLYSQSDAFPSVTFTVPVILGEALVTP
jgi:hypothetical protein